MALISALANREPIPRRRRVLLGQLISNGDCLYATTVARQIKSDDPNCHLTWAISARCRNVLRANPHVDAVWEWPSFRNVEVDRVWKEFKRAALLRKKRGEFDVVYFTQFFPDNVARWNGTLRSSILAGYPGAITVPVAPVIRLEEEEIENVARFAHRFRLQKIPIGKELKPEEHVILFECSPQSTQSFVTPEFAISLSRKLIAGFPGLRVIISSHLAGLLTNAPPQLIDGSQLSFRENAELSHYCSALLGCSSGLTWLCTSEPAKHLPMVEILSDAAPEPNSVVADHLRFGLPTDDIIELYDCSEQLAFTCITAALKDGFQKAHERFHEDRRSRFAPYQHYLRMAFRRGDLAGCLALVQRYKALIVSSRRLMLWHVWMIAMSLIPVSLKRNLKAALFRFQKIS